MVLVPIVVRPIAPRSGSTLLMRLLATSPLIAFDRIPPFDRRYLRYLLVRCLSMISKEGPASTSMLQVGGTLPADPQILDPETFVELSFRLQWQAFSEAVIRRSPDPAPVYYAERDADATADVDVDLLAARIPVRSLWLIRDPRDAWASIGASDPDPPDRRPHEEGPSVDDPRGGERLDISLEDFVRGVRRFWHDLREQPEDGLRIRFEDLVLDPGSEAGRLEEWLGVDLDPGRMAGQVADPVRAVPPADSIGRWRRDLPPTEQRSLTTELADVLEDNGYS